MIHITDVHKCCGCEACANICPKQCITMRHDDIEGFKYPQVDTNLCVGCNACERVCPMLNDASDRDPIRIFAAKSEHENIRRQSSSGAVFTALARNIISRGGIVFGVAFDDDFRSVSFVSTDKADELAAMRGSKYLQANANGVYAHVRETLRLNRPVLFTGTPCQVRALRLFLAKEASSPLLYCVDIVCHGVPSPMVWAHYLDCLRQENNVTAVSFRDKTLGWKDFSMSIDFGTRQYSCVHRNDLYMQSFLRNVNLRPSCYCCNAKHGHSGADITIGDFWGVPSADYDSDGVSQVIVLTDRGAQLLRDCDIDGNDYSVDIVRQYNPAFFSSVTEPTRRRFFWHYHRTDFAKAVRLSTEYRSLLNRLKSLIRKIISTFI